MRLEYAGKSHVGKVRRSNEDYFFNERAGNEEYIFIVADGMGGHKAGEVASSLGTLSFVDSYKKARKKNISIRDSMIDSIINANNTILAKASEERDKKGMGTTFTGCVIHGMKCYVTHVGDSRLYLIRDGEMTKVTSDHTFVEKMVEEGKISEEEARNHPQKNILYMSLGARKHFTPQVINGMDLQVGDKFVICSDGLDNMVRDEVICKISEESLPEEAVNRLVDLANINGGTDNITVQVIRVLAGTDHSDTVPLNIKTCKSRTLLIVSLFIIVSLIIFFLI